MPVPVLVPLATLIAGRMQGWLAWVGLSTIASALYEYGVVDTVKGWIVQAAMHYAGLELNEENPLSDESFSAAMSKKLGFPIRTLKDQQSIKEDLEAYAAAQISERSGYLVRSVSNVDMLKEDLVRVSSAVLSEKLGIPAGVIAEDGGVFDPAAVKERLLIWAKAELMSRVEGDVLIGLQDILAVPDVESAAAELNNRLGAINVDQTVTARRLAVHLSNLLATDAVTGYQKAARAMTKRQRRQESLRAAQAKFRRRHGKREVYVPLGFSATVTENQPPAGG